MTTRLAPLFARVLIEREKMVSRGGLIIPEEAAKRNAPTRGTVIAVGPTADDAIRVGSTVLFGRHAGTWIEDGTRELYVIQDEDVLATIEEATP